MGAGVASIEAAEAVASSIFLIMMRVSRVLDRSSHAHTPHTMCIRSDNRDRLTMSRRTLNVDQVLGRSGHRRIAITSA